MCTSETVVCYGVVMRSWQIIVAAKAFAKFSPQLRGIDLIIARQRIETLKSEPREQGTKSIMDLPLEVLEVIRSRVFSEKELGMAARKLVRLTGGSQNQWRDMPRPHSEDDWAWDFYHDALCEVDFGTRAVNAPVTALLEHYGLKLVSHVSGNQQEYFIENGSTSVVALPASIEKFKFEVKHEEGLSRADGMKLPSPSNRFDSAPNFRRFYRDFHFDVVSEITTPPPTAPVVPEASPVVGTSEESSGDIVGESKSSFEKVFASIKPEWIIWTASESCQ